MTDNAKYKCAILEYGLRKNIVDDLTSKIREAALFEGDAESTPHYNCHSRSSNGDNCLDRLWTVNKENYAIQCIAEDTGAGAELLDLPELCPVCAKVQALIDERKKAKRFLAAAKGRVTRLATNAAKAYFG